MPEVDERLLKASIKRLQDATRHGSYGLDVVQIVSGIRQKDELIKELRAFIEKPVPTKHYSTKKEGHFSRNCSLCEYERERAALLEKSKPVEAILSASKGVEENQ